MLLWLLQSDNQRLTFDGLNISQIEYYNGCTPGRVKNNYLYDADHRLERTTNFMYTPTRVQDNYSSRYYYDMAGNITSLTRNGFLGMDVNNDPTYGLIDQLIYTYDTDLFLRSVKNDINVASEDYGFRGEISGYDYDDRGNMITSTLNDLTIEYNPINLPGVVSSDFGSQTTYYSTGGSKIMTVNEYDDPSTGYPSDLTRMYFMGMELEYEGVGNFSSTFTPKAYNFGDGRLLFDGSDIRKQYHLHDHLGNVVVVFEDKNNDGFIEETDNPNTNEVLHRYHYYSRRDFCASKEEPLARPNPAGERDTFGMLWDLPDPLTPLYSDDNRYQYNGKEFEQVANLLDYGWRWYDPVIGRWGGVDPLAESFLKESPYNYVGNNPITYIDVKGKFRLDPNIIRDYPHFASYIQNNVIDHTNSEHLMSAFLQHTNLSRDQIIKDFSWGEGPLIITGTRTLGPTGPVFGQYDRNENGDPTIFLEESLIKRFEESMKNERLNDDTRQALLLGISGTLFHEYGHHGGTKDNDGTARALDNAIWGTSPPNNLDVHGLRTSLHKFRDGIRISPNNLNEIIETVPHKKDINIVPRLPKLD